MVSATGDAQTDMQSKNHRFLTVSRCNGSQWKGSVSSLASFILTDWLSAVADLGFPPMRKKRGKGGGASLHVR